MRRPPYLETSAVLRAVLESGTSPDVERRIQVAPALVRVRALALATEAQLADASWASIS